LWNDEIGEGLMTNKIKSKLDGIKYNVLGPIPIGITKNTYVNPCKKKNITSRKSRNSRTSELVNLKNA